MINHSASHVLATDFEYVRGIIERNYVGPGVLCEELRQQLASRLERSSVTLADSGTAALHLCLAALAAKEPRKSGVLVGAYVCPEVISAVMRAGLVPVLVDCRIDSLNVDMSAMAEKLDANTLAVICTGIGGTPDDIAATADGTWRLFPIVRKRSAPASAVATLAARVRARSCLLGPRKCCRRALGALSWARSSSERT